jgi:hypothetical protein
MGQPGMRVTVDAAMRARDVSRPMTDDETPAADKPAGSSPSNASGGSGAADGKQRRLGKRHARR